MITQEALKSILHYDPETGLFSYVKSERRGWKAGRPAGCLDSSTGYIRIRIKSKLYYAHRAAVLYMTGKWPEHQVDHKDCVRCNNAWANLRLATSGENRRNSIPQGKGPKGLKGVGRDRNRFCAQIYYQGKKHHLGNFGTPEEAHAAYCAAAERLFGEFARSL
jgi:hypothetical protein